MHCEQLVDVWEVAAVCQGALRRMCKLDGKLQALLYQMLD